MPHPPRPTLKKKASGTALFLMILAGLVLSLEMAARLVDLQTGFHYRVAQLIEMLDLSTRPVTAREDLPWEDRHIFIRAPEPDTPRYRDEIFTVGGRRIPGAHAILKITEINPAMLPDGTQKIFITGGSTAFGFPYLHPFSFAAILEKKLAQRDAAVINTAQISFPSGRLVPLVRRIVRHYDPDTLIIMSGNNEWMNWRAHHPPGPLKKMIRVFRGLSHSRLLSAAILMGFKKHHARDKIEFPARGDFTIQKELEGFDYALQNPLEKYFDIAPHALLESKQKFLHTFRDNLRAMVALAQRRRVRVILMTVPFSYRLSPAFMYPQPLTYRPEQAPRLHQAVHDAAGLIKGKRYERALAVIEDVIRADPLPPLPHYLRAVALERLGRYPQAQAAYARSRENMIGHLGSRLSVNNVIREVSRETGAELVDVQKIFEEFNLRRGRFFAEGLIEDDCHPTPLGHRLIAAALRHILL